MNFNELREQYQTETGWLPINYVTKEFTSEYAKWLEKKIIEIYNKSAIIFDEKLDVILANT